MLFLSNSFWEGQWGCKKNQGINESNEAAYRTL
jgi:hypothetical protein